MRVALALLSAVAGLAAPAAPAAAVPPDAIALVAGVPVPRSAYDQQLARVRLDFARRGRAFPAEGTSEFAQVRDAIVALLVQRETYRQEALELGIEVTSAQVDEEVRRVRMQVGAASARSWREYLRRHGYTEATFRAELEAQLRFVALTRIVTRGATASEAELRAYYAKHRRQYRQPETRAVRHIMVATRRRAEWIRERLVRGGSWAALARRYSRDPGTKQVGGRLTIGRGQTVQPFDRLAFSLRTGTISRPFRTRYGWHVLQPLSPVRAAYTTPYARVRATIREIVLQQRRTRRLAAWQEQVRAEYAPKIVYQVGFELSKP